MQLVGKDVRFHLGEATKKYLHPKNNARTEIIGFGTRGQIGIVHPTTTQVIDSKVNIVVGGILLDNLFDTETPVKKMKFSKYPSTTLDFTFTTDKPYGDLKSHFDKFTHPYLFSFRLKDIYQNNFTLEFSVGSHEKTLDGADLDGLWKDIVAYAKSASYNIVQ